MSINTLYLAGYYTDWRKKTEIAFYNGKAQILLCSLNINFNLFLSSFFFLDSIVVSILIYFVLSIMRHTLCTKEKVFLIHLFDDNLCASQHMLPPLWVWLNYRFVFEAKTTQLFHMYLFAFADWVAARRVDLLHKDENNCLLFKSTAVTIYMTRYCFSIGLFLFTSFLFSLNNIQNKLNRIESVINGTVFQIALMPNRGVRAFICYFTSQLKI